MTSAFVLLAIPAVVTWCAPAFAATVSRARITGSATYRERVALAPAAVFEARLESVSRADAPAKVIARVRNRNPGQVPIAFTIPYDPRRIDPRGSYVVHASIYENGRIRFTSRQGSPVVTRGNGKRVTVLMRRASRDDGPGGTTQAGLENTRWRPIRIGDRDVIVTGQQREPWIVLEPRSKRVTGSGGCNRISGSYEAGVGMLRFGPLMSTKMACAALGTETAFLRALGATWRYRVRGRILELMDERGRSLARLEERNL
jgi:putative lipoprotein